MSRNKIAEVREPSQAEIDALRMLRAVWREGDVREVRAFKVPEARGGNKKPFIHNTVSGYFDNPEDMAREALRISDQGAEGVFWTPNPVNPALLARAANRMRTDLGKVTSDEDIVKRVAFILDVDSERPSGISATDEECAAARRRGWAIIDALESQGWPTPIVADSGNGAHAFWYVDLPNDAATLDAIKGAYEGLKKQWDDEAAKVDGSVCNAARVIRMPGTMARKGDSIASRPHRLSALTLYPDGWCAQAVTAEQLAALAPPKVEPAQRTRPERGAPAARPQQSDDAEDVRLWIDEAMACISPDCGYGEWISVGVALKDIFGADGLAIFDRWSSASAKYPGADQVSAKWEQLAASRHPGEEARTIIGKAIAGGFDMGAWRRRQRAQAAQAKPAAAPMSNAASAPAVAASSAVAVPQTRIAPVAIEGADLAEVIIPTTSGRLRFGAGDCVEIKRVLRDGEYVNQTTQLGRDIWPLAIYTQREDGSFGVRIQYRDPHGALHQAVVSAAGYSGARQAAGVGAELARQGVQVATGKGSELVLAIGAYAESEEPRPRVVVVTTSGWHKVGATWAYVMGQAVLGAQGWSPDEQAPAIRSRLGRSGSLAAWRAGAEEHLVTAGLEVAYGMALAGSLVERLGATPWLLHFWGRSSCGKSSAARVAAAVWGPMNETLQSWDTTGVGLEILAENANGSCLVLDELGRFRGDAFAVARAVHTLGSIQGRQRAKQDGSRGHQRQWRGCTLSTGEVSMASRLGPQLQGGHAVRALDLHVEIGAVTQDAAHSRAVYRWTEAQTGCAGEAWVRYLCGVDDAHLLARWEHWQQALGATRAASAEQGRIIEQLAMVALALELSGEASLFASEEGRITEVCLWVLARVNSGRADSGENPEERALRQVWVSTATQPAKWPTEKQLAAGHHGEVWGISRYENDLPQVWTTREMLAPIIANAGADVGEVLKWAKESKLAFDVGRTRIAGQQRRWWCIDLDGLNKYFGCDGGTHA